MPRSRRPRGLVDNPAVIAYDTVAPSATLPFLVSFPRTGSHWLRSFLELYFDRPLLRRSFHEHDSQEFLLLHTHDLENEIKDRRDVVYLYRGVVSTVFSQLTYHHGADAPHLPAEPILATAHQYRRHLRKWLLREDVAARKCVLTYEALLDRPVESLSEVITFLGGEANDERIIEVWPRVTLESVRERTTHDPKVISADADTHLRRELFRYRWGRAVVGAFTSDRELAAAMDPGTLQ